MIIWEEVVGQVRWNLETKLATAKLELFHSTNKLRNYITKQLHLAFNPVSTFALFLVNII